MSRVELGPATPLLIVSDVSKSVAFYARLGFELRTAIGEDSEPPYFAIVGRDALQLMVKSTPERTHSMPNHLRHEWVPWDVFVFVQDPDSLAAEYGTLITADVRDWDDGVRGFEVKDIDGYVLFFGRPVSG